LIVALKFVTKNRVRIAEKMLQSTGYTIYHTDPSIASVIDPKYPDKEKKFEQGKTTSKEIDKYLKEGHTVLKIQRLGDEKDTKYTIQPPD
jgi:hypothetical protein